MKIDGYLGIFLYILIVFCSRKLKQAAILVFNI